MPKIHAISNARLVLDFRAAEVLQLACCRVTVANWEVQT